VNQQRARRAGVPKRAARVYNARVVLDFFRALRGVFYPPVCFRCGAFLGFAAPAPACPACREALAPNRGPFCPRCGFHRDPGAACGACRPGETRAFDHAYFVLGYEGPARRLVRRYKIGGARELGPLIAGLFDDFARREMGARPRYDAVVPVPPHRLRRFGPAWAPSLELGRIAARIVGAPVRKLLAPTGRMKKQSSLTRRERAANVRGAFRALGRAPETVLLVDDVLTTGHTASECARLLKAAGARRVDVLASARGRAR
jgi:predicted amidophosphoribosyltransferase